MLQIVTWIRSSGRRAVLTGLGALLLEVGAPVEARAQRPDPMSALVEEALRNNAGLAQARASERRAAAESRQARGLMFPSVSLESRYSRQSGTLNLGDVVNPAFATLNELTGEARFPTNLDITLPRSYESRLRLTQPLFDETIRANHALARHRSEAESWQRRAAARKLAAEVQVSFLEASAAASAVGILGSSLALVRENERVAERLVAAQMLTPEVVFRARAEQSDVEQQLLEARERARAAERALNRIVGRPLDESVPLLPTYSVLCMEIGVSLDEAEARALAGREELRQADAGLDAAGAARRIANAAFLPSVGLALDFGYQGNRVGFHRNEDYTVASLVVSWRLFDGGRNLAGRQVAQAERERLLASRREAEDLVRLDVRTAYDAAVVARSAIGSAQERVVSARRTFDLVRRKWEEGVATQIEFIDARVGLTGAELNRELTIYRYGVRYVELERAAALREVAW